MSAWLALSPATVESGCIRLLPGSHPGPKLEHVDTWEQDNMLTRGQTIMDVDESKTVNLELQPEPACDFDPAAVALHQKADEEQRKIYYQGAKPGKAAE